MSQQEAFTCPDCGVVWTVPLFNCCGPCPACGSRAASEKQDAENAPDYFEAQA